MKGIELSEKFYLEYGAPMIRENFSHIEKYLAVGLAGSGSECMGFDDEISRDHDFEPGFCIFLPDEEAVDLPTQFALERAYSRLPSEFMGYKRNQVSPVGGNRHGVIRMSEFFLSKTGKADGDLSLSDWFFVPEQSLIEATNGKIFRDDTGKFTSVRNALSYMPEDVRLKKLAGNLIIMGQSGQYNYSRCIGRGENGAAQLAAAEFVKSAMHAVFLINRQYIPYYKWSFKALSNLPRLSELYSSLEYLISSGNENHERVKKSDIIEDICSKIFAELSLDALTSYGGNEAEGHAYSVNDKIKNGEIRNLHIMYAT